MSRRGESGRMSRRGGKLEVGGEPVLVTGTGDDFWDEVVGPPW